MCHTNNKGIKPTLERNGCSISAKKAVFEPKYCLFGGNCDLFFLLLSKGIELPDLYDSFISFLSILEGNFQDINAFRQRG